MMKTAIGLMTVLLCLMFLGFMPGCEPIKAGGDSEVKPEGDDTVVQMLRYREENEKLQKENARLISKLDLAEEKSEKVTIRNGKLEKIISGLEQQIRQLREQLDHFKGLPAERNQLTNKVEELTKENLKLTREIESLKKQIQKSDTDDGAKNKP